MTPSRRNVDPVAPAVHPVLPSVHRPAVAGAMRRLVAVVLLVVCTLGAAGEATPVAAHPIAPHGVRLVASAEIDPSSTSTTLDDGITQSSLGEPLDDGGSSASEDRKIWAVVAGLVLVAIALTALTVRYWRQTRPVPAGSSTSKGRRARTDDEPADDGDFGSDIFVNEPERSE